MKRALNPEQQRWADEAASFLREFGQPEINPWSLSQWQTEMLATGWHIGDWPGSHGGADWPAWRSYLWQQALHRHFHNYQPPASLGVVAPLLLSSGTSAQQQLWLPGIATLSSDWCLAYEPGVSLQDGKLDGQLTSVSGFANADMLLLTVDEHQYAIVPVDAPGIESTPATTHSGERLDHLRLQQVGVVDRIDSQQPYGLLGQVLGHSQRLRRKVQEIYQTLEAQSEDEDLRRRFSEAEISMDALQAMELRYVDASSRRKKQPFPLSLIDSMRIALDLQLAELHMDALGYFALPDLSSEFDHNVGPIGLAGAQAAVREWLESSFAQNSTSARPDLYGKLDGLEK